MRCDATEIELSLHKGGGGIGIGNRKKGAPRIRGLICLRLLQKAPDPLQKGN